MVFDTFAGFLCQSCETEIIEVPVTPTETYSVMTLGEYFDGKFQIPEEGITYVSKDGVTIYYCETRPEGGKSIYEEVYSPRYSIGGVADWDIGDTVVWVPNNPEQIIKIIGSIEILSE